MQVIYGQYDAVCERKLECSRTIICRSAMGDVLFYVDRNIKDTKILYYVGNPSAI